jgi:isopenicillin-N epimerase
VSNLHKWLYAPRGTAMLYASGAAASLTRPLVTSHYVELGFPRAFDYVGTRDYSAWLAAPAALEFLQALGPERLRAHQARLIGHGRGELTGVGAQTIAPAEFSPAMCAFLLPQSRPALPADAAEVMARLWDSEHIQVRCALLHGALLLRICAQAYVEADDITQLARALDRIGWPARR